MSESATLIVEYADFVSEDLLMATAQPSVPDQQDLVVLPVDEEGTWRTIMRREWRPSLKHATTVVVYLSPPRGGGE